LELYEPLHLLRARVWKIDAGEGLHETGIRLAPILAHQREEEVRLFQIGCRVAAASSDGKSTVQDEPVDALGIPGGKRDCRRRTQRHADERHFLHAEAVNDRF